MSDSDPRPLLRVERVAEQLDVTPKAVRGWIYRGQLPVVRLTRRAVRVRPADLDAFVAARIDRSA